MQIVFVFFSAGIPVINLHLEDILKLVEGLNQCVHEKIFHNRFQLLLLFQAKFAIHKADDEHANNDTYIIECQGVGATNSNL